MIKINLKKLFSFIVIPVLFQGVLIAQEEFSYDVEPKLEWSGNLDAKYSLLHMNQSSAAYKLQFFSSPTSSSLSQYRLEPYLNAEYKTGDLGFYLKTHATYYSDNESGADLFEAYGKYNLSFNAMVQAGKRVYSWGKGYAFNPVGFVNPVKDPENPELAQAGILSANVEYIKSFSSEAFQSLALQLVVITPDNLINGRYGELKNTDFAFKTSFLMWDTDIDMMTYYSKDNPKQFGIDFSRNIQENIEIHGEFNYSQSVPRYYIAGNTAVGEEVNPSSYLIGLRYLGETNTTVIAEYYHNDAGLTRNEFENYNSFLTKSAASNDAAIIKQSLGVSQSYFRNSTLMKDYIYLKVTQPEPFDWLYFTPSAYTIYNLADKSFLAALMLNYKPATNIEFILWATALNGKDDSEYGSKQIKEKIELWMRVFF
ncbi:MAG: hypothetical protein K8H86_06390 [Ignavibacteriaceae bacterium]|nr:hypothetical protein [Ignavibacteriaceae bacterium]